VPLTKELRVGLLVDLKHAVPLTKELRVGLLVDLKHAVPLTKELRVGLRVVGCHLQRFGLVSGTACFRPKKKTGLGVAGCRLQQKKGKKIVKKKNLQLGFGLDR
jgi:hypothetical protein